MRLYKLFLLYERKMRLYRLFLTAMLFLCFFNISGIIRGADKHDALSMNAPLPASNALKVLVVACNRPEGMLRTLDSARNARNVFGKIDLHICVDGCGNDDVERLARSYVWPHGRKTFTIRKSRYGLARNIVSCWEAPKDGEWALLLEDDVVVAPLAFRAFKEGLMVRSGHQDSSRIVGIALHDMRVNQYCWNKQVRSQECPHIHSQCETLGTKQSIYGSLVCQESDALDHKWVLRQLPSSWGVFYSAKAWSLLQQYIPSRASVTPGSSLAFTVPHSMSNEWSKSWKRFLLEIMLSAGWTLMYRSHPTQVGFSTTLRGAGEHTTSNAKKEAEAKCLLSLPLLNSTIFVPDDFLREHPSELKSYGYCNEPVSGNDLIRRGAQFLSPLSSRSRSDPDVFYPNSGHSSVTTSIHMLREAHANETDLAEGSSTKEEIVLVTSTFLWSDEFKAVVAQFKELEELVTLVVVAPPKVCYKLRGAIHVNCLMDDSIKKLEGGSGPPRISSLVKVAADVSLPGVTKWTGLMNADIAFDHSLVRTLSSLYETNTCGDKYNQQSACVVTGRRRDAEETVHSVFGIDYFLFNNQGLRFALRDGVIPSFTTGQLGWDNSVMGAFVTSTNIHVIDASESLRVVYHTSTGIEDAHASEAEGDQNSLKLAGQMYRIGRTDFANFGTSLDSNHSLVPIMSNEDSQSILQSCRFRWTFDYEVEKATHFFFSPSGSRVLPCFCRVLATLVPSVMTTTEIGKLCSTNPKTLSSCQTGENRPVTVFKKEVFEMIANVGKGGLDISGADALYDFGSETNSSCCVLENDWELPHSFPGPPTLFENEIPNVVVLSGPNKTERRIRKLSPRCLARLV